MKIILEVQLIKITDFDQNEDEEDEDEDEEDDDQDDDQYDGGNDESKNHENNYDSNSSLNRDIKNPTDVHEEPAKTDENQRSKKNKDPRLKKSCLS